MCVSSVSSVSGGVAYSGDVVWVESAGPWADSARVELVLEALARAGLFV